MFNTFKRGSTSNIIRFVIRNSASPFNPKTGVVYTSSGLVINVVANNSNTSTLYQSASTATIQDITTPGTYSAPSASNCRFKAVDATNHPGLYEVQFLDSVFSASNAKSLTVTVRGVTGYADTTIVVTLTDVDPFDPVRFGQTALPNAAAEAAGGLITRGTGAGQVNQDANGRIDVNIKSAAGTAVTLDANNVLNVSTKYVGGTAQTARDIGASVLLSAGTGTGQLDFTGGVVKANATQLLGTAWLPPGTAGTPDVNAKLIGATAQTGVDLGATRAEPGQGTPGATISFLSKIDYLYKAWRNKKTQTSTTFSLFNDDAATVDQKATVSDDGTTTTIGEVATGP